LYHSDIAAKMPVLLSTRLSQGKTMGNAPLVPYMMSMQVIQRSCLVYCSCLIVVHGQRAPRALHY
jgi:hypothetical protein